MQSPTELWIPPGIERRRPEAERPSPPSSPLNRGLAWCDLCRAGNPNHGHEKKDLPTRPATERKEHPLVDAAAEVYSVATLVGWLSVIALFVVTIAGVFGIAL